MIPSYTFTWPFNVRAPMQKRIQSNNAGRISSPFQFDYLNLLKPEGIRRSFSILQDMRSPRIE